MSPWGKSAVTVALARLTRKAGQVARVGWAQAQCWHPSGVIKLPATLESWASQLVMNAPVLPRRWSRALSWSQGADHPERVIVIERIGL
jgi:hypothetical protein